MPEPATTSSAAIIGLSTTGVTLFGLALGLRPELVLAGLWGAFWALSYADPMPLHRRCTASVIASILAGYGTPAAMAVVDGMGAIQAAGAQDKIQYPVAVGIGFLAHRILGPLLMRLAARRAEDVLK